MNTDQSQDSLQSSSLLITHHSKLITTLWHGADYNYEQWLHAPDVLDEDFRLMREARCNIMSIGIFAWSMLEPSEGGYTFDWLDALMDRLAENGMFAALATPSAAPPAWLSQAYPETRRVNAHGQREPHRRRQNFCYTSPVYRQKTAAINRLLAERYKNHPALLLWHVSNEYGASQCHCDLCYSAFRDWLKARYGTLDALNAAYWATFWSHRYTDWDQIEPVDNSMQGLMLDWQRFTSDRALDFFLAECAPLREITPEIPLTTNFMQPDVGLDYWKFAPHVDIVSWDSYPRWHLGDDTAVGLQTAFYHDLHRSYKRQPFLLMESSPAVTNWQGISRLKQPGMHKLSSMQAVAHGANSVQYFQWRQSRGGEEKFHGAVVSHTGADNRTFRDVTGVGELLSRLDGLPQTGTSAQIAIIYDFENEWALNHAALPHSTGKHYQRTCRQHYGSFWRRGDAVDVIDASAGFSPYRLIVAPMLYMLKPGVAERLETFVQSGGTLVTTYLSGLVDESDLCIPGGIPQALRRTLGLYPQETDAPDKSGRLVPCAGNTLGLTAEASFIDYADLLCLEGAQPLAAYASEFYAGSPAVTVNRHGAGRAYYLAARTDELFLDAFYGAICREIGLEPALPSIPAGVSVQMRESAGARYLFVMNFSHAPQTVEIGAGWTDAATGESVPSPVALTALDIRILRRELS